MCLTEPGLVVRVEAGCALVAFRSGIRRALTLLSPDVRAGDQVVVSAGAIVCRIDDARAHDMRAAIATATATIGEREDLKERRPCT